MINLLITMSNGQEYKLRNNVSGNVKDFVRNVLSPRGAQMRWAEIIPGLIIQTEQIVEIRPISDEELEKMNAPVIVPDAPLVDGDEVIMPNEQISEEITESEDTSEDSDN